MQLTSNSQAMAQAVEEIAPEIMAAYERSGPHSPDMVSPTLLRQALEQLFQILAQLDSGGGGNIFDTLREVNPQGTAATTTGGVPEDMTELGEYGIGLLQDLAQWAATLGLARERQLLEALTVPMALWTARHGGQLTTLEPVVNSLAAGANQLRDAEALKSLSRVMGELADAVAPASRGALEAGHGASPWRILNLNRGIVATRSQDPAAMEAAFEELLQRLPADAAAFFAEGIKQTAAPDYPAAARAVMERFYEQTQGQDLH